jgi:hypothetical protein
MRRLRRNLGIILLILFFFEGPFDYFCFLYFDRRLDVDVAQDMASEAFAKRNPDLRPLGGRTLGFDPFAYTIEVRGYKKTEGKLALAKTEVYRVHWWGEVVKLPLGALPWALLRITAISSMAFIMVEAGRWLLSKLKTRRNRG